MLKRTLMTLLLVFVFTVGPTFVKQSLQLPYPHHIFLDFLYGAEGGKDIENSVKDHEYLAQLEEYTVSDWLDVIQK
jgi:Zn-dependent M16 (insulinase) family peptidase